MAGRSRPPNQVGLRGGMDALISWDHPDQNQIMISGPAGGQLGLEELTV